MTADEIERCRTKVAELRRRAANVARGELVHLVESIGWALRLKKGGHPVYEKKKPWRYPITIPAKVNRHLVNGILDRIEDDLDREDEEDKRGRA
jgi:predicted RNA binding protein YcfA (HicA-like mRNA interferase family)